MDKRLIAERFAKARGTYSRAAQAQRQVAEKMIRLLQELPQPQSPRQELPQPRPSLQGIAQVVEIGCGTGLYTELLLQTLHPTRMLINDLCAEMEPGIDSLLQRYGEGVEAEFVAGDAEELPLPPGSHLITSCSTVQWFIQPQQFVARASQALVADGLLALSTFGGDNLSEIRSLTGHGLSYPTLEEWHAMMPPSLQMVHAEEERVTLWFSSPTEVLHHLRETGVSGTEKRIWTRSRLNQFCQDYTQRFADKAGRVPLTYHPIYLIAKKI